MFAHMSGCVDAAAPHILGIMTPRYAIALDFGGTKVEAALVDENGVVEPASKSRTATGALSSSAQLAAAVSSVLEEVLDYFAKLDDGSELLGVGIGTAGPINMKLGLVSPLNVPAWRDYPLRDLVCGIVRTRHPELPVTLRLDGLCIALAEHWVGAGRGYDNVMGMVVSTGIGGGLILAGRTVPGPTGNAGHIGHIEAIGLDEDCACGGRGCVEAGASGPRTVAWANRQGWTGTTGEELSAAFADGDPIAIRAVERSGRAIGQAIASAASLVDLDIVAIGGGFSHVAPELFGHARAALAERSNFDYVTRTQIVPSSLSGDGPLIGAAALIHRAEMVG